MEIEYFRKENKEEEDEDSTFNSKVYFKLFFNSLFFLII